MKPLTAHLFSAFSFLSPFSLECRQQSGGYVCAESSSSRFYFPGPPNQPPGSPSLLAFLALQHPQLSLGAQEYQAFQAPRPGQEAQGSPSPQGLGQVAPEGLGLHDLPLAHGLQKSRWVPGGTEEWKLEAVQPHPPQGTPY